jgi:DNA-binding NtrC family response regulator
MALILVVEDEKLLNWSLTQRLEAIGHTVHSTASLAEAAEHLRLHQPDLMLLDLALPDGHGLDFFEEHRERLDGTVVLVMTAVGEVEDAVRAMKLGALDFLTKPVEHEALVEQVNRSLEVRGKQLEAEAARDLRDRQLDVDIVARSEAFARTLEIAEQVGASDVGAVLVQGESGTGKNLLARYIHASSARASRPLLEVSCAAIPEQLLESELFGHEKGAFTDAKKLRRGTFELANTGTVVLDEVGELRPELQSKLLHFLEERYFRRVGGGREIHVDIRIIALTNRDLKQMLRDGGFRQDLFYRLSVFPLTIPPLRSRREDVLPLARHFLKVLQGKLGRRCTGLSREAENVLLTYHWPGNVRELRNSIERALILERGEQIGCRSLVLDGRSELCSDDELGGDGDDALSSGIVPLEVVERIMVERALNATDGNQSRAAELLGITRDQLRYRLKKMAE